MKHIILVFIFLFHNLLHAQSASDMVREMFAQTKDIRTMTFTMDKIERVKGKMITQRSISKINLVPLKVYLKQLAPKEGVEVLYVNGWNNNLVMVNPNGFPWFSVNLDPYGSTMRENQHHTLLQAGYGHVICILEHLYKKYDTEVDHMTTIEGSTVWDHQPCWIVTLFNEHCKFYNYKAAPGETASSIAQRDKLSEHLILEKNPWIKSYTENLGGKTIIIPNDYAPKITLYIDKVRKIPLVMKIYDQEGLYEQYAYSNLVVNPFISAEEFNPDYKEYDF